MCDKKITIRKIIFLSYKEDAKPVNLGQGISNYSSNPQLKFERDKHLFTLGIISNSCLLFRQDYYKLQNCSFYGLTTALRLAKGKWVKVLQSSSFSHQFPSSRAAQARQQMHPCTISICNHLQSCLTSVAPFSTEAKKKMNLSHTDVEPILLSCHVLRQRLTPFEGHLDLHLGFSLPEHIRDSLFSVNGLCCFLRRALRFGR